MGYREALEAAGAFIHCFQYFGTYQGDWWAKVTHVDNTYWIHGEFGSCSCCDAFEMQFGHIDLETNNEELASFGKYYLENAYSQHEAEKAASKHMEWDMETERIMKSYFKGEKVMEEQVRCPECSGELIQTTIRTFGNENDARPGFLCGSCHSIFKVTTE